MLPTPPARHSTPDDAGRPSPKWSAPRPFGLAPARAGGTASAPRAPPGDGRRSARLGDPQGPVFPGTVETGGLLADAACKLGLARRQGADAADGERAYLVFGIACREHRAEDAVAQAGAGDGDAMPLHEHQEALPEGARERRTLLRLDHQHVGVAELVALVPERRPNAAHRAEMEDRHIVGAGGKQRHEGGAVMMAHRHDVGTRLVDLAMDDALGILADAGLAHRTRVEVVFDEVVGRDQLRRARARQ